MASRNRVRCKERVASIAILTSGCGDWYPCRSAGIGAGGHWHRLPSQFWKGEMVMMEAMMKMKSALVGLVLGGLRCHVEQLQSRPWHHPIDTIIRQVKRASRYRPAFNGGLPSVKRAQRRGQGQTGQPPPHAGWVTHESPPAGYRRHDGRGLSACACHRRRSGACALGLHGPLVDKLLG